MIAKLRGIIDQIGEDYIIIDVSGVGYLVYCSSKVINKLSPKGQLDEILIETIAVSYTHLTLPTILRV